MHSPFLYNFYTEVINGSFTASKELRQIRKELLKQSTIIEFEDPKTTRLYKKSIGYIAKGSLSTLRFNQFLSKLINWQQYESILETGTSLGYNALFISKTTSSKVFTIEGSKSIHRFASQFFQKHEGRIHAIHGSIHDTFKSQVALVKPQLIFLDADHRSQTILKQLEEIKQTHIPKCLIIHDIYWSEDMQNMWQSVTVDQAFPLTIDIYQAGIIFPYYPGKKQHFQIRF